jgi:hypothetical protein
MAIAGDHGICRFCGQSTDSHGTDAGMIVLGTVEGGRYLAAAHTSCAERAKANSDPRLLVSAEELARLRDEPQN